MPVRSSSSPVLRWPDREAVLGAARAWTDRLVSSRHDVLKVGCFGSYARGDWGVGSDLDLVVVVDRSEEPPMRRGARFDTVTGLPVPVDLLVYTAAEWQQVESRDDPFTRRLLGEVVWLT